MISAKTLIRAAKTLRSETGQIDCRALATKLGAKFETVQSAVSRLRKAGLIEGVKRPGRAEFGGRLEDHYEVSRAFRADRRLALEAAWLAMHPKTDPVANYRKEWREGMSVGDAARLARDLGLYVA